MSEPVQDQNPPTSDPAKGAPSEEKASNRSKFSLPPMLQKHNEVYGHPKSHWHVSLAGGLILVIVLFASATALLFLKGENAPEKISQVDSPRQNQPVLASKEDETVETVENPIVCESFTDLESALNNVDNACILDLSNQGLTEVPEEVYSFTNLHDIDLSDNNLTEFPSRLLKMINIFSINLSNNDISSIPESGTQKMISSDGSQDTILRPLQNLQLNGNPLSKGVIDKLQINGTSTLPE